MRLQKKLHLCINIYDFSSAIDIPQIYVKYDDIVNLNGPYTLQSIAACGVSVG